MEHCYNKFFSAMPNINDLKAFGSHIVDPMESCSLDPHHAFYEKLLIWLDIAGKLLLANLI